jgi:hypothetical protein
MQIPVALFGLAGLALVTAMWQAVRRPPRTQVGPCVKWHALRVMVTAGTATLAAACVIIAVQQLS